MEHNSRALYLRLLGYLKPYWKAFSLAILGMVGMAATDNVSQAASNVLVIAVRESLTALALISYLLYLDWRLTLITLAIGPVIALIIKGFSKRVRAASRASFEAIQTISHTTEETVGAHKVVKIYGGQAQQTQRFWNDTERFRRSMMREAVPAAAITPITHLAATPTSSQQPTRRMPRNSTRGEFIHRDLLNTSGYYATLKQL